MDSQFTMLLRRFVECYESDPEALEIGLIQAEEGIRFSHDETRYKDEWKARRASQKRTRQEIAKRLLAVLGEQKLPRDDRKADALGKIRRGPAFTWEEYEQERIEEFRNALAALWGMPREKLDEALSENGITDDRLFSLMQDPQFLEVQVKYKFAELSRPDFHVFFAREFLSWLDTAVAQVGDLEEVSYRKTIPAHLKSFLGEAYRCYLFGLDAACAALCGAILQEAIRVKLNAVGFTGLSEAIRDAEEAGLLTPRAAEAASEINSLRIDAAHGKQAFVESQEYRRKSVLSGTREILDTLFAEEI